MQVNTSLVLFGVSGGSVSTFQVRHLCPFPARSPGTGPSRRCAAPRSARSAPPRRAPRCCAAATSAAACGTSRRVCRASSPRAVAATPGRCGMRGVADSGTGRGLMWCPPWGGGGAPMVLFSSYSLITTGVVRPWNYVCLFPFSDRLHGVAQCFSAREGGCYGWLGWRGGKQWCAVFAFEWQASTPCPVALIPDNCTSIPPPSSAPPTERGRLLRHLLHGGAVRGAVHPAGLQARVPRPLPQPPAHPAVAGTPPRLLLTPAVLTGGVGGRDLWDLWEALRC